MACVFCSISEDSNFPAGRPRARAPRTERREPGLPRPAGP